MNILRQLVSLNKWGHLVSFLFPTIYTGLLLPYILSVSRLVFISIHFFTQMYNYWFYAKYQHKSSYFCWTFSRRKSLTLKNKIFKDENRFVQIHPKSLKWTSTVQCNIFQKCLESETEWDKMLLKCDFILMFYLCDGLRIGIMVGPFPWFTCTNEIFLDVDSTYILI